MAIPFLWLTERLPAPGRVAGQMTGFFAALDGHNYAQVELICYIISAALLVLFWVVAFVGGRKKTTVQ